MRWRLADGQILQGQDRVSADFIIEDSHIEDVVDPTVCSGDIPRVSAEGLLITPGLIDLHVHGAFGTSFSERDPGPALRGMVSRGVTTVVASLASGPLEQMCQRADLLTEYPESPGQARIVGVHLEGPFLSAEQAGAHHPSAILAPAECSWRQLLPRDSVTMVTLAPELSGSEELIRALSDDDGCIVAAGHSQASAADLAKAVRNGLTHATHLWSGMSSMRREGPWRVPGLVETCLSNSCITGEIIADGKHLPRELLEIARSCLGERLVVVSDGTVGTGMPEGYEYQLGEVSCVVAAGVGQVKGADSFAGSVTALDEMVRFLISGLDWPQYEVFDMVTSRPAALLGRPDLGCLSPGALADLVLWDPGFMPQRTIMGGDCVYGW